MVAKRLIPVLVLSHALAAVALAQSVASPAVVADPSIATSSEFGRVSGGEIDVITKHPRSLSGSFGISTSRSQSAFGNAGKGFDATLGGTLVQDRVWFFASAQHDDSFFASRFANPLPATPVSGRSVNAKLDGNLGDRQSLAASFAASRAVGASSGSVAGTSLPSSFLTMHYTGIVSDSMFFTATVSQSKTAQPLMPFGTVQSQ